jgi:hypothetical protein
MSLSTLYVRINHCFPNFPLPFGADYNMRDY